MTEIEFTTEEKDAAMKGDLYKVEIVYVTEVPDEMVIQKILIRKVPPQKIDVFQAYVNTFFEDHPWDVETA